METTDIIRRLDALGVVMSANGGTLELRPGSRVPEELHEEIRRHKADLLNRLACVPTDSELAEIVRLVQEIGFALLWSHTLQDTVAFVQTQEDALRVPCCFVIYTVAELTVLFGDSPPSTSALKLIHKAKKHGGQIVSDE